MGERDTLIVREVRVSGLSYQSTPPSPERSQVDSTKPRRQGENGGKIECFTPTKFNNISSEGVCSRELFLKLVAFCISCIAKFVAGSVFVFFLYQTDIKVMFQYSQIEVELLGSMINIGLGLGFIPGMIFDKFGPTTTSILGLLMASGSYLLVWSTTFYVPFYEKNTWIMAIYFLLAGFGPGFTLMTSLNTNIINFGENHIGKVIGVLNAFFAVSPSVFASVYYAYFDSSQGDTNKFADFILMIAILFAVANALCIIFVRFYGDRSSGGDVQITCDDVHINTGTSNEHKSDTNHTEEATSTHVHHECVSPCEQHVPLKRVLLHCDFQLMIWSFSFASAVSVVFGVNITIISKSVGLSNYNKYLTIILPICNAVLSSTIGIFSDYFKVHIPRLNIIICGYVCFIVCTLLVVILPEHIAALMTAAGFCGIGVAIIYSLGPALIKEMTNTRNFGRNWGIALFLQSAVGMPSQLLFGAMYDGESQNTGSNECVGKQCIVGGMSVFVGMSSLALILGLVLKCKESCDSSTRRKGYQSIDNAH